MSKGLGVIKKQNTTSKKRYGDDEVTARYRFDSGRCGHIQSCKILTCFWTSASLSAIFEPCAGREKYRRDENPENRNECEKKIGRRATSSEMEQPTPNGKLSATAVRRVGRNWITVGGVGRRVVEEDIAALSARYRRDVRENGIFLKTGRRKLPFLVVTTRTSSTDVCALETRIFPGTRGRRTIGAVFSSTDLRWCFVLLQLTRRVIEFVGGRVGVLIVYRYTYTHTHKHTQPHIHTYTHTHTHSRPRSAVSQKSTLQ